MAGFEVTPEGMAASRRSSDRKAFPNKSALVVRPQDAGNGYDGVQRREPALSFQPATAITELPSRGGWPCPADAPGHFLHFPELPVGRVIVFSLFSERCPESSGDLGLHRS